MLRILGRATSANVQKVVWLCDELGIPFEREDIGGPFGGNDKADYRALNPNGVVPTIIEDDFVLWESNACVHYLASKYAQGTWYPEDLRERADAVRWMEWSTSTLSRVHVPVFQGLIRTPKDKQDPAAIAAARDEWSEKMAMLERYLDGRDYLTGDTLTIGDIPSAIFSFRWFNLDIPREDYPNVERWWRRIAERPAYQKNIVDIGLV